MSNLESSFGSEGVSITHLKLFPVPQNIIRERSQKRCSVSLSHAHPSRASSRPLPLSASQRHTRRVIVVYNRDTRDTGGDTGPGCSCDNQVFCDVERASDARRYELQAASSCACHAVCLEWQQMGASQMLKHPISHSVTLGLMSTCTVLNYGHYIIVRFDDGEQVGN